MTGMDGTSKCENCGEKFNRFSGYNFEGKLCNNCLAEKPVQRSNLSKTASITKCGTTK